METKPIPKSISVDSPEAFLNRELSWLWFARRVLALVEDPEIPLLERVRFVGIMGMLHDEFFMKRISGLKRMINHGSQKRSQDGLLPEEIKAACRKEVQNQVEILTRVFEEDIRKAFQEKGIPILEYTDLNESQKAFCYDYFKSSVEPVLTPLAVDAAHPFPFISNLGLNLAIEFPLPDEKVKHFIRLKVPNNRPRWTALPGQSGFVPLEQIIAAHLNVLFPQTKDFDVYYFRVTRGAEGDRDDSMDLNDDYGNHAWEPGGIIKQVTNELRARRFAGVIRLQVDPTMPERLRSWLGEQLEIEADDIYETAHPLSIKELNDLKVIGFSQLRFPSHKPVIHPRLYSPMGDEHSLIFDQIKKGDILLHHPYHSFTTSVLRFLQEAAADPTVLAIKLTIYRTSENSPIVKALADAARRGKQVAVVVEVTARFDEAPNIAWGKFLEESGAHVAYGVEEFKTHVKLALIVREEKGRIKRYLHIGTGNYHTGTALVYEDLGLLTCDESLCNDASAVFNELTGATPFENYSKMLVAPHNMRKRFTEMIQREARNAQAGKPSGIRAKMNQLQDPDIIRELYLANQAGVPIFLVVRGLCCLRPGVPGLSENIRVISVLGRFLEHSRIYCFENAGNPEYYIGSADWMRRNLNERVETITPVETEGMKKKLSDLLDLFEKDNHSAWDCQPDGSYKLRQISKGGKKRSVQDMLILKASKMKKRRK
jgi:polyphosphate kinase